MYVCVYSIPACVCVYMNKYADVRCMGILLEVFKYFSLN